MASFGTQTAPIKSANTASRVGHYALPTIIAAIAPWLIAERRMTTSFTELQKGPQFRPQSENGAWLSTKHMITSTSSPGQFVRRPRAVLERMH